MLEQLLSNPDRITTIGLLFMGVVGLIRGWVVPGYLYDRLERSEQSWKAMALRGTDMTEISVQALRETKRTERSPRMRERDRRFDPSTEEG